MNLFGAAQPTPLISRVTYLDAAEEAVFLGDIESLPCRCMRHIADSPIWSEWWPASGGLIGQEADGDLLSAYTPQDVPTDGGADSRLGFAGVTRDAGGAIVPACTVRLHRSSDGSLVQVVESRADGSYEVASPYGDAHYVVVTKDSATPPLGGATPSNMIPG